MPSDILKLFQLPLAAFKFNTPAIKNKPTT